MLDDYSTEDDLLMLIYKQLI